MQLARWPPSRDRHNNTSLTRWPPLSSQPRQRHAPNVAQLHPAPQARAASKHSNASTRHHARNAWGRKSTASMIQQQQPQCWGGGSSRHTAPSCCCCRPRDVALPCPSVCGVCLSVRVSARVAALFHARTHLRRRRRLRLRPRLARAVLRLIALHGGRATPRIPAHMGCCAAASAPAPAPAGVGGWRWWARTHARPPTHPRRPTPFAAAAALPRGQAQQHHTAPGAGSAPPCVCVPPRCRLVAAATTTACVCVRVRVGGVRGLAAAMFVCVRVCSCCTFRLLFSGALKVARPVGHSRSTLWFKYSGMLVSGNRSQNGPARLVVSSFPNRLWAHAASTARGSPGRRQ